ncbi:MAG: endopeptidase La [Gammaproteobacteria bacterium]
MQESGIDALEGHPAQPAADAAVRPDAPRTGVLSADTIAIVPVRNVVLFPDMLVPLSMGREKSIAAVQSALSAQRPVGLLLQRDPAADTPGAADLHGVGTIALLSRHRVGADGTHHVVCQGRQRFRVLEFVADHPYPIARIELLDDGDPATPEIEARVLALKQQALEVLQLLPQVPAEVASAIEAQRSGSRLADLVSGLLDVAPAERQELLETVDVKARLDALLRIVAHRLQVLRISEQIGQQTRVALDERQREAVLREQLKTIQKELGDSDDRGEELSTLERALDDAGMPEDTLRQARKELKRLQRMGESSGEASLLRTYLEWLSELPWARDTEDRIDLGDARRVLDEDHYGLAKIKRRILEYLAVRKLNPEGKSPILCFVGPPGVGKTSLGSSIARATGRKFARISLGGVHDEAEIRGHRRTYIGALPGNVVQALRKAGSRNPVIVFDEIDKLGMGAMHGDPSAALLEVLDPEQNASFRDNYLGVSFDLSKVLFICTANVLENIPAPLRDRMEIVPLPGYTQEEKHEIARRYLVPRQQRANGLGAVSVGIDDAALEALITGYTREAGVRNLERELGAVFRSVAMRVAEGASGPIGVGVGDLLPILGPRRFENEVALRAGVPGVATGLAWTAVGGDILFIEATKVPGSGRLILTGQLGDVMKESAQAALSCVKAKADVLGIAAEQLEKSDIHVHVPAGATPKDGPSAGVAIHLALVSLLTGRCVRPDVAMTGEISLRGLVLPVGGIKEKVLAALRAGIRTVLLPRRNAHDIDEIPASAREQLEFVWLDRVEDAEAVAFTTVADPVAV